MVAHFTMRTYGVNHEFRFVTSKESGQIRFVPEKTYFTSYVRNMFWATILYKYNASNSAYHPRKFYTKTYFWNIEVFFSTNEGLVLLMFNVACVWGVKVNLNIN